MSSIRPLPGPDAEPFDGLVLRQHFGAGETADGRQFDLSIAGSHVYLHMEANDVAEAQSERIDLTPLIKAWVEGMAESPLDA